MAATLATKVDGPVRVKFTREEVFTCATVRHAFKIWIKDGVRKDGKLMAREAVAYMNGGAYADWGYLTTRNTVYTFGSYYWVPNIKFDAYGVYTNQAVASAFRGFGNAQLHFAVEQQMDILAEELGIDPAEFRRLNFMKDGQENVLGERVFSFGAPRCLDNVLNAIGWGKRPKHEDLGVWKRGIGFAMGSKYSNSRRMCHR
jgi:carbon-monoxide dehydrogenase large subunit